MKPLTTLLFSLLFSTLSAQAPMNSPLKNWRSPDGTLNVAPDTAEVTADAGVLRPGAGGLPVFFLPFEAKAGDVVSLKLTVETLRTAADAGAEGQAGVVMTVLPVTSKSNSNPDALHRQIVIVGLQAETIEFAFRLKADHAAGSLMLLPTLSYFERSLRLRDISWKNHGGDADPSSLARAGLSYPGQAADAPWRAKAAARIDQHRKADLTLRVTDPWGRAIPGALVSIEQLRHAYPFGTALQAGRIVDAPRVFTPESGMTTEQWRKDNLRYRAELERNFNTVVFENDTKWPQWNGAESRGVIKQEWTQAAMDWLHTRRFSVKGHTMVWGSWRFTPTWLKEKEDDPEALQQAILAHIRDIGNATADRVAYWDVLNEPMSHRNLIELLGTEKVAEWFKEARAAVPGVRLVMNEFDLVGNGGSGTRRKNFLQFYQELKAAGVSMDLIGFQGHFWSERFTDPERIWEIIDEIHGATALPLMVSEFDTNVPNEQLQADYTRDFLTAWFAHPATEAFIMWGFWGGAHWMGDAGAMFRKDWSEKPNLKAYRDLVYGDWWTRDQRTTDDAGRATIRVFLGRHRVTLTPAGGGDPVVREIDVSADGRTLNVVLP